jgi:putative peptidoglycan lipid II flippase
MLLPSLHVAGFRFRIAVAIWTPAVRRMLALTGPVAIGAGVLQIGVLMDKGIGLALAEAPGQTHVHPLGYAVRLPMVEGAAARLDLAQFMYQFPLGVFAIALATAIFPKLSAEATSRTGQSKTAVEPTEEFRSVLRRGIEASMFIGLPASAGMALVAWPAARLLFQHGKFTAADANWVALSTAIYSSAIWAFSLLQIVNRAYYALHDAVTPLRWVIINLLINLIVELPLLWTPLRESAMAVGTLVSFAIQSIAMLWLLNRRTGTIRLREIAPNIAKMLAATAAMSIACLVVIYSPLYPSGSGKLIWAAQLGIIMIAGAAIYFVACWLMGLDGVKQLRKSRQ